MSHKNVRFPLSLKELQRLSETESGILLRKDRPCRLKMNYSILPVNSKAFRIAINEELNKRVLKYNPELDDMILRYFNVRVKTPIEATRSRKLLVFCVADIYVFKPQCESTLKATVTKKSGNHIGCLMHNVFNVSIIKPPDLPFKEWPGRNVEVNDIITFKAIKVDVSDVIPYIIGELDFVYSYFKDVFEDVPVVQIVPQMSKSLMAKKLLLSTRIMMNYQPRWKPNQH